MRISRFTWFAAIVLGSAIAISSIGGVVLFSGESSSILVEAMSQEFDENRDSELISQRRRRGELLRSLTLSSEQKAQLFDIQTQYKDEIRVQKQSLRTETTALRQLMVSDAPADEVSEQFSQVQSSRQALDEIKFKGYLAIREVLTVEQRKLFSDEMQSRRQPRGRRRRVDRER